MKRQISKMTGAGCTYYNEHLNGEEEEEWLEERAVEKVMNI